MLALTDIFKTIVHSEIEHRQGATQPTQASDKENSANFCSKLNLLEEQN